MGNLSRRGFLRFIPSLALAPLIPDILPDIDVIPVEYGWTWSYKPDPGTPKSFANIVRKTLAQNGDKLAENITRNNALYLQLADKHQRDHIIKVNYISQEEQNKRMIAKTKEKLELKERERLNKLIANSRLSPSDENYLRVKQEIALANGNLYPNGVPQIWYDAYDNPENGYYKKLGIDLEKLRKEALDREYQELIRDGVIKI